MLQKLYTTWVRGVACQKQRLGPKLEGGLARAASKNLGPPMYFCNRYSYSNFKFGTQLGFATNLPKNNVLDQNWRGSWLGENPKNGTPYLFLPPLKLATSSFVHKFGLGLAYQKTTFRTKIGGSWVGVHPKSRSLAVAERPRDASCLSVVSFNIPTARFFITSYCGFRFTSA